MSIAAPYHRPSDQNPPVIYHLAEPADWAARTDEYRAPSLESEQFIHCSTADQIAGIAAEIFPGRNDLILLTIDEAQLPYPVVCEDLYGSGETFPHVYGPIPLASVIEFELYLPG